MDQRDVFFTASYVAIRLLYSNVVVGLADIFAYIPPCEIISLMEMICPRSTAFAGEALVYIVGVRRTYLLVADQEGLRCFFRFRP